MNNSLLRKLFLTAALVAPASHAAAEDIDIYQSNNTAGSSNLLVVFDNSASGWDSNIASIAASCPYATSMPAKGGGIQSCGMWRAVDAIGKASALEGKINMGIMMLSPSGPQPASLGGTFRFPVEPAPVSSGRLSALVKMDKAGIDAMKANLQGLTAGNSSASRDVGGSTWESWAFYAGKTGPRGAPAYPGVTAETCGKNFVIRVGVADSNANPADQSSTSLDVGKALLTAMGIPFTNNAEAQAVLDKLKIQGPGSGYVAGVNDKFVNNYGDEWARFMKQKHEITTYTITLIDASAGDTYNPRSFRQFMKSVAYVSGGRNFEVSLGDMEAFVQALLAIFNEIQAINSVFASASLPVSENAQGSFKNQIYFGMFRPDGGGRPRWAGNLKQYRFALSNTRQLYIADARPNNADGEPESALSAAGKGFFSPEAVSFWTKKDLTTLPDSINPTGANTAYTVPGGFFINIPQDALHGFDLPDGQFVEKGGVAQQLRLENLINNYADTAGGVGNPRRLYTCTGSPDCGANASLSATPFAVSNTGLTDAELKTGSGPVPISTLTRVESTATVVTSAPLSPSSPIVPGQIVTITGTSHAQYYGDKSAGGPPVTTGASTTFTFPVAVLPPISPAGTFIASLPGLTPPLTPTSIVREGDFAIVTVPSNTRFAGNPITITGAGVGFDKTTTVAATPVPTPTTFAYPLLISPGNSTGGTAKKGAGALQNIVSMTRGTPETNSTYRAVVVIEMANNLPGGWAVSDSITFTGTNGYDGTHAIHSLGTGNAGICQGNPSGKRFCIRIETQPQATNPPSGILVSTPGAVADVTLTRTTSCTSGSPTAVVTATRADGTDFAVGDFLSGTDVAVSGGDLASVLYTGTKTITSRTAKTFTYNITTDLPCADTSPGKQVSAGGATKTDLVNWVRGEDTRRDELVPNVSGINVRMSIHGDVLHSRPAVIDYGSPHGVVVFYGANDGVLRAINGNQTGNIGSIPPGSPPSVPAGVPPGGELWGFIAPEFFPKLMRLYLNTPVVKLEGTAPGILPTPQPKDYFFDGNIGTYEDKVSGKKYLYATTRRGGRLIYALDVTDPVDPKFLWKIVGGTAPFEELGQTWSTPKVTKVKGHANPVLIFGAGYDPVEDLEPAPAPGAPARTMGRGIFIVDAINGNLVWQAKTGGAANTIKCTGTPCLLDMPYPIPADITLVNRDFTGETEDTQYTDRLYAADLGGNVWRVDLEPSVLGNSPANWRVTKFAEVGGLSTDATKRKIFFAPDVVLTKDFDAVMFATGDREHPTLTQQAIKTLNRFYMLKDTRIGNDACPLDSSTGVATCPLTVPIKDDTTSAACIPSPAATKTSTNCTESVPTGLYNSSLILPTTQSTTPFTIPTAFNAATSVMNGFYINLINAIPKTVGTATEYGPEVQPGEKSVNAPTSIGGFTFFGTNGPIAPEAGTCQPNLGISRGYAVDFFTGQLNVAIFEGGGMPPNPVAGTVCIGTNADCVPFVIGGVPPPICVGDNCTAPPPPPCSGPHCAVEPPIVVDAVRTRTYWYRDIGNR